MGQAKLRGTYEQRVAQGIEEKEKEAWVLNRIIDAKFIETNTQRRQRFLPHVTKSFLADHIFLKKETEK